MQLVHNLKLNLLDNSWGMGNSAPTIQRTCGVPHTKGCKISVFYLYVNLQQCTRRTPPAVHSASRSVFKFLSVFILGNMYAIKIQTLLLSHIGDTVPLNEMLLYVVCRAKSPQNLFFLWSVTTSIGFGFCRRNYYIDLFIYTVNVFDT